LYLRFLFKSSYAFRTQEWFDLARDDVVRLRRTPLLVSSFGWLVGWLFVCLVGWLVGWLVGLTSGEWLTIGEEMAQWQMGGQTKEEREV
jgi:hypothetical protein